MADCRIHCVGDIFASNPTMEAFESHRASFDEVRRLLASAHVRFGNLEAPLISEGRPEFSTGARLQSPPSTTDLLAHLGFDIVSVANNHAMDFGPAGLASTLSSLKSHSIRTVGAGETLAEARSPVVLQAGAHRIGFLASCDDYGGGATRDQSGVSLLSSRALLPAVARLREQVDYVVVSLHTGIEFCSFPEPYFVRLSHRLIDAGASLIVGHHPHVPQGIERYGAGLIVYSLGDFVFDLVRNPEDFVGRYRPFGNARMTVEVDFARGSVAEYRVHWLVKGTDGALTPASADEKAKLDEALMNVSKVLNHPTSLRRSLQSVYLKGLKELLYYTPYSFYVSFRNGSPKMVTAFVWWLGTLWKKPRRRFVAGALSNTLHLLIERVKGTPKAPQPL